MGSKRRIFSATECVLAVQGHPRSMILVPIESAYATFYIILLVGHCDCSPALHRFWDTATYCLKIAYFSYPSLIRRPRSYVSFEFRVNREGASLGALPQWKPHDPSWSRFGMIPACDRRSGGQTDGFIIANTALCIASYTHTYIHLYLLKVRQSNDKMQIQ